MTPLGVRRRHRGQAPLLLSGGARLDGAPPRSSRRDSDSACDSDSETGRGPLGSWRGACRASAGAD